jgi:hypothetical protein
MPEWLKEHQWKPGQSGNPGGRPKTRQVRDALQKLVNEQGLEPAVKAIYAKATEGDVAAFREIADRLDGKVPQAVVGDDEHPPIQTQSLSDIEVARRLVFLFERGTRAKESD